MIDTTYSLGLTARLAAVGLFIGSCELLARPLTLGPQGLLSWEVARLRSPWLARGRRGWLLDRLMTAPGVDAICVARIAASLVVIVAPVAWSVTTPALLFLTATSLLLMLRTPYGNDGADQMLLIVVIAVTSARLSGSNEVADIVAAFVAAQALLAYATSGIGKLAGSEWRNGKGIVGIMRTTTYGVPRFAHMLDRWPALAVALSWSVIVTEIAFPLVLLAPDSWVPIWLLGGLMFHVSCAAVMGLNTFVWAFLSTYPAIAAVTAWK